MWFAEDTLTADGQELILSAAETVYVSAATVWELEIKRAIGRLDAPDNTLEMVATSGFERLPVTFEHAVEAGRLPLHHRDPFDRMLVAQARMEGLTLATADAALSSYDVPLVEIVQG